MSDTPNDSVYNELVKKLTDGLSEDQVTSLKDAIDGLDRVRLLSAYASVQFAAPEARVNPSRFLFRAFLEQPMTAAGLDTGQIISAVNRVAGVEVIFESNQERKP